MKEEIKSQYYAITKLKIPQNKIKEAEDRGKLKRIIKTVEVDRVYYKLSELLKLIK